MENFEGLLVLVIFGVCATERESKRVKRRNPSDSMSL